jgi:hypothetical protein
MQLQNNRRTAVPIGIATFLCLALCLLSWEASANMGDIVFKLTEESQYNTREEGLPKNMPRMLEDFKDQKVNRKYEFLMFSRQETWQNQAILCSELILKRDSDDSVWETEHITEAIDDKTYTFDDGKAQSREAGNQLVEIEAEQDRIEPNQAEVENKKLKDLEQRVKQLETEKTAREEAVRSITRDALSTIGSKINESVSLGGTLEVIGGWTEDYSGQSEGVVRLNTAELDFEIEVNEWTLGSLTIEYDDGTDVVFPTTSGYETKVDRVNLDTAFVTIGDQQRFPPFLTFGRIILPFGISTGDPVADVLTIEDPLTIEAFELRNTAIGIGFGFPTPALTPPASPVVPPPVKPLVINPLFRSLFRSLGYKSPPKRPPPPTTITPKSPPPLFNVGIYSYDGSTYEGTDTGGYRPEDHFGATAGFRTGGNCGRPYDQLGGSVFCPWSIDVDVDYNSSIFDSRFLEFEYQDFLGQIGFVPGMAASVKATMGPVSFIAEWNGAINQATFADGIGNRVTIRPSAWQTTIGYQFDWNPWVEEIGAQGNYIAIGYSESRDLAGVKRMFNDEITRVGFVPRRRFIVSVGEWIMDNVKLAVEYSHNVDYPQSEGGTDNSADGIFSAFTIVW